MKEQGTPDHIEIYDNALPGDLCNQIIESFEQSGKAEQGKVGIAGGAGVNTSRKDSYDLTISSMPGWEPILGKVHSRLAEYLVQYVRKIHIFIIRQYR